MQILLLIRLLKKLSVRQAENFVKIFKNKKQKSNINKDLKYQRFRNVCIK